MSQWPSTLDFPQYPRLVDYSETPRDTRLRSNTDSGFSKTRNRFTKAPADVSESYVLTKEQAELFENFFEQDLSNGSITFTKPHPRTEQIREYIFGNNPYEIIDVAPDVKLLEVNLELLP